MDKKEREKLDPKERGFKSGFKKTDKKKMVVNKDDDNNKTE